MYAKTSRRHHRPAAGRKLRAPGVRPCVELLEDRLTPANIGYYDMNLGEGNSNQVAAIMAAGHTPVKLFDLTAADLAGIAVIDVQNPSNGGYGAEYLSRLTDIENAVAGGAVLVIHDRFVDPAETILPAGATFNIVRDFTDEANIDVRDNTTLVTNGPGGIVDNSTLDGGTSSSHGFAFDGSLPTGGALILSTGDPTHIVTFAYLHGAGTVIYSTIPLDHYRAGSTPLSFSNIYAPNVLAYAATNPLALSAVVSADNPSSAEGAAGATSTVTFTLTRTGILTGAVVVDWSTADGTATAGSDYVADAGQITFQDGETEKTVTITVTGDDVPEFDETFDLVLSTTTPGAEVSDGQATIVNDDTTTISTDNPIIVEGPAGSTAIVTFTLQRTGILAGVGVVNWATTNGAATAGSDYVAASGQVTFQDGETQKTVPITVNGDDLPELDETFNLVLSTTTPGWEVSGGQARILNDDMTTVNANNPSVVEGLVGSMSIVTFTLQRTGSLAGTALVNWSTANGTATAGSDYFAASGQVMFLDGETQKTVPVMVNGDNIPEPNETFILVLSTSAIGWVVNGGQATILNDDVTKFFVVNDTASLPDWGYYYQGISPGGAAPGGGDADRTYRYDRLGNVQVDTAQASGNGSSRGAASTVAGDKLWVVDANKNVYVYAATGALLGSWSAGGLSPYAKPEGIATNGADVWIVDAYQDKVFRFTGAAALLSGTQNADNSFSLNLFNNNPKGIVTDGASFWVVNSSATDKVFKYSLSGSFLGSWTIDAGNSSPTGITLDPSSVSHLWIVDNTTDRVYQYDDAAGRTSGAQAASMSFALAPGNTNPQDIADPPPGLGELAVKTGAGSANSVSRRHSAPTRPSNSRTPQSLAADWLAAIDLLFSSDSTKKWRR